MLIVMVMSRRGLIVSHLTCYSYSILFTQWMSTLARLLQVLRSRKPWISSCCLLAAPLVSERTFLILGHTEMSFWKVKVLGTLLSNHNYSNQNFHKPPGVYFPLSIDGKNVDLAPPGIYRLQLQARWRLQVAMPSNKCLPESLPQPRRPDPAHRSPEMNHGKLVKMKPYDSMI